MIQIYLSISMNAGSIIVFSLASLFCCARPALTFANLQVCNEEDKIAIFCNLSRDRYLAGGGSGDESYSD